MTDRELLENAAKAAGYKWRWFGEDFCTERDEHTGLNKPWNPLTDDGDVFRLLVAVEAVVGTFVLYSSCSIPMPTGDEIYAMAYHSDHGGKEASTRRAIVLAVAELGSKQ